MTQQDDLQRFITAQKRDYETALLEIKQGRKQTHCKRSISGTFSVL